MHRPEEQSVAKVCAQVRRRLLQQNLHADRGGRAKSMRLHGRLCGELAE
jgi:hypothetical protein